MDYNLIVYFFAGIIQDFIITLNWRFIDKDKIYLAMTTSFLSVVIYLSVLYTIMTRLDSSRSVEAILAFALGVSLGTFIAMKVKIKRQ